LKAKNKAQGGARICPECQVEKFLTSFNVGESVCTRCEYALKKHMTEEERAAIVARKMVKRLRIQFASPEDEAEMIRKLTWNGSRRTRQTREIKRW
jgi:uncharacterized Zn finger protein (UPF0148 family)